MVERKAEAVRDNDVDSGRKEYFTPKIVHTEKLTALASACAMADSSCQTGPHTGPIQS